MKKISTINYGLILLLAIGFSSSFLSAQTTTFQKIYPSTINQSGTDVFPGIDGGYIITASTATTILNDIDIKIMKTDSMGNMQWTKTYGGAKPDYPNRMLKTNDGNYFVIGYTQSFGGGDYNDYLLKLKPNGDTIFTKNYGGFGNEDAKDIVATADGNYVIVGNSNSVDHLNYDMQLIKIGSDGHVIWTKNYGGPDYESARSVKLCLDGGFIIAGRTALGPSAVSSIYLVKTDADGNIVWTKTISGGANSYQGKSVLANSDGTYTLAIDDSSGTMDSDVRVMKLDATGNTIIWNKVYGGVVKDIVKTIQPTSGGGYVLACISRSFGWINPDMWIVKLNASGDSLWTRHYGGLGHEHCLSAKQTADGGYIAIGHSKSYTPNTEIMFVKLDSTGKILPVSVDELALNTAFTIYPNPSGGTVKIDWAFQDESASTLKISNILGQTIYSEDLVDHDHNNHRVVDLTGKEPGIYFVSIQSAARLRTEKLILK
jgi:hypothetical protein